MKNLLFLHGFTHNGAFFDPLRSEIEKSEEIKVYNPNFYGRGDSDRLERTKDYNYLNYVKQVEDFTQGNKLQKIDLLLGSSMGGLVAMMFCEQNPNIIKKLILNDIGYKISREEIAKIGSYIKPDNYFDSLEEAQIVIKEEFGECGLSQAELSIIEESYVIKTDDEKYKLNYDYKISDAFWKGEKQRKIPDMDYKNLWESMIEKNPEIEIILFRGEESSFFPRNLAEEMLSYKQVKDLIEIPNCGHLPMFLCEEQINLLKNHI